MYKMMKRQLIFRLILLLLPLSKVSMLEMIATGIEKSENSVGVTLKLTLTSQGFPSTQWREIFANGSSSIVSNSSTLQGETRRWPNTDDYRITLSVFDSQCHLFEATITDEIHVISRNMTTCENDLGSGLQSTSKPAGTTKTDTIEMHISHVYVAAGVGGGVTFLLISITAILCIKKRRKKSAGGGGHRKDSDVSVSGVVRSAHPYAEIDSARFYEGLNQDRRDTHCYTVPETNQDKEDSYLEPVNNQRGHLSVTSEFSSVSSEFENPVYNVSNPPVEATARTSRFLNLFNNFKKTKTKANTINSRAHANELYNSAPPKQDQEMPSSLSVVAEESDLGSRMNVQVPLFKVSEPASRTNAYENVQQQRSFKQHNKVQITNSAPGNYVNIAPLQRKAKLTI